MDKANQFASRQGFERQRNIGADTRPWRCGLALVLAGALLAPSLFSGCDKMESPSAQADRAVKADVEKSEQDRQGPSKDATTRALNDLKSAASRNDASDGEKARANSLLGQAEYEAASQRMLQIERDQLKAQRILWEIHEIGAEIAQINATVARYKLRDPKTLVDQINKQQAEAAAKQDQANQKINALNADLQKRQADIKQMENDKAAADTAAETSLEKSQSAKGDEFVKLYTAGQEARRNSGTLAARLGEANAALEPIKQEIAQLTTQASMAGDAVKAYEAQKQQATAGWTDVSTQINERQDSAKKLVSDRIVAKAKDFKATLDDIDANRAEADNYLKYALAHFQAAQKSALKYYTRLDELLNAQKNPKFADAVERTAWKDLQAIYSEYNFVYQVGLTQQAQGNLAASHRAALIERQKMLGDLTAILDQAGATWPSDLGSAKLDADVTQATTDANTAFAAAVVSFEKVYSPQAGTRSSSELKNSARASSALVAYARYQVGQDAAQLQEATKLAGDAHIRLPNEKPEFVALPAPPPPTSAPATEPAEGAAPPAP